MKKQLYRAQSVVLCLILMMCMLGGCRHRAQDVFSDLSQEAENAEEQVQMVNPWRDTTKDEILELFGETLNTPKGAKDAVYRLMESEQLAELTFLKDGYAWAIRMKKVDKKEDISGLYYDWDYETQPRRISAYMTYIDDCVSIGAEVWERQYVDQATGTYIGSSLWYVQGKKLQYSASYVGGDYTTYKTFGEAAEYFWGWTQEKPRETIWDNARWWYEENELEWPYGDENPDLTLGEEGQQRLYTEMGIILDSQSDKDNVIYSPLLLETVISALAEGSGDELKGIAGRYLGRTLEEERMWCRSVLFRLSDPITMFAYLGYQGNYQDKNKQTDIIVGDAYNVCLSTTPNNITEEESIGYYLSEKTKGAIRSFHFSELPGDDAVSLDGISYFHGMWEHPYDVEHVGQMEFISGEGEAQKILGMVSTEERYMENEAAQGFVKYYEDGRYTFVGILPKESGHFNVSDLDLPGLINSVKEQKIQVVLPAMIFDSGLDTCSLLNVLGLKSFTEEGAIDNAVYDKALTLSAGMLETHLRIDPAWRDVLSITDVADRTLPVLQENIPALVFDRPFVFLILDTETQQVLFCGNIRTME